MRPIFKTLGIVAAMLTLTACGDMQKGFEDGFKKQFHEEFVANCTSSAIKAGSGPAMASKICNCSADKLEKKYSAKELMNITDEQMMTAGNECLKEAGVTAQ